MTKEQSMKQTFDMFDVDGNGCIDRDELISAFKILGENLSNQDIDLLMELYDEDGNGTIEFDEFCKMMKSL